MQQHRHASEQLSMASIVAEELRRSPSETARPSAWSEADEARLQATLGREAYIELMAATEEELVRELQQQEEAAAAAAAAGSGAAPTGSVADGALEYEEFLEAEDALLQQIAEAEAADGGLGGPSNVLCPLCVRAPLVLTADGCVACSAAGDGCALRLDARGHPQPLELLRERMDTLLREHGQRCGGPPCCRLPAVHERHLGMLLFCCNTCGVSVGVV